MPGKPDKDIKPPFSKEDEERMREILKEARIKPEDFFHMPRRVDPTEPGKKRDPNAPKGRAKETYNGQKGDGTFQETPFDWQPDCGEPFEINISEAWTPPPAGLANKFDIWAEFATVRAIMICLRNPTKCRLVHPLGCNATYEIKFANGQVYARAIYVFECAET
jgi:hypothetical protein